MRDGWPIVGVLAHPEEEGEGSLLSLVFDRPFPILAPVNVNEPTVLQWVRERHPDVIVMAGYGQILQDELLAIPRRGVVNLHGGLLPSHRGSSPMNWALLRGEKEYGITAIQADLGVDTGVILGERRFPIHENDTIVDMQSKANKAFPLLLLNVLQRLAENKNRRHKQRESTAQYFPRRFPEDGAILWDQYSAKEIHNRIRALTGPYPNAFTYFGSRRIRLLRSVLRHRPFFGEPGRVYQNDGKKILVCARDRCLWITEAVFDEDGREVWPEVKRYSRLATIQEAALAWWARSSDEGGL